MKNKPVKGTKLKHDTVTQLEQKNRKLQIQIDTFKNKILKLENKIFKLENKTLKQERQILKLQQGGQGDIFLRVNPHKTLPPKDDK